MWNALLIALSTYSVIPMPQCDWSPKNTQYAICFFPAVGIFCGAALALWYLLCQALGIGPLFFSLVAVCLPLLLTGGIHMDGYMDTVDALASHQTRERKLEILKDSCSGAFAVIYCGIYLLLSAGLLHELYAGGHIWVLLPMYCASRALSALCAVTMPNARKAGMLCSFLEHAKTKQAAAAMVAVFLVAAAAMLLISPLPGLFGILAALIAMLLYRRMAKKQFGGATGDTAGFFLQICELSTLLGVWIGGLL